MNKQSIPYLILTISLFFFGCRGNVKEQNEDTRSSNSLSLTATNEKYAVIDPKKSVITWKGTNLIGTNSHKGYVYLSKGELLIENGKLTGGAAEINMSTIEDEDHGRNNGLVNHLKDADFFDVKKFPVSTIVLNKTESINGETKKITGNLTIKGITKAVTFPAKIEITDGIVKMNGKLVIDRTQWGIRYKSGKFFAHLADQTISDSIEFHINIVAKK